MPALLEARSLHAGYGETRVLHGIDFAVEQGGVTALLGANGAGKTTTLRAICGMVRTSGEIRLGDERIDGRATEDIVQRGVAHVPDGRGTFFELTVEENLRLGATSAATGRVSREDFERMFGYFPRLRERFRQQAGTLSGGEQQMLAIARALLLRPQAAAAGRAVVRPGAADRAGDLRDHAPHPRGRGRVDPAGGAERQPGAGDCRAGVSAGDRTHRGLGAGGGDSPR